MVLYNGLTKAEVLCALYNHAKCQGLGFLQYVHGDMALKKAEELLKTETYFDYINGRVLKVDLSGDEGFEEWLYDRDNGSGAAQRAVNRYKLLKSKTNEDVQGV